MGRSIKKEPFVEAKLMAKIDAKNEKNKKVFTILGEMFILRKDKTTQKQFEKNPKRAIEYITFRNL